MLLRFQLVRGILEAGDVDRKKESKEMYRLIQKSRPSASKCAVIRTIVQLTFLLRKVGTACVSR